MRFIPFYYFIKSVIVLPLLFLLFYIYCPHGFIYFNSILSITSFMLYFQDLIILYILTCHFT